MGLIILIIPLIIYYSIVVPLVNRGIIEKIENQRKKAIFFWLLVFFPIADHIVGYVVYKALCFSVGGVHIYKTVTDVEEQRAYWFYDGLKATEYHGNDEEYKFLVNNGLVRRNGKCLNPIKQEGKDNYSCKREDIERVYLNYCNDTYNTLPKEHKNYKKSCTNADELITQYHLENVIKVPKSSYSAYVSNFDKNYHSGLPLFYIRKNTGKIYNRDTQEILATYNEYGFGGGWYVQLVSPYSFGINCGDTRLSSFEEQVIPNPYNNQVNTGDIK